MKGRRARHFLIEYESESGDRSGEWIIENGLMARMVEARIKEIDPDGSVSRTEIKVHDSVSSWERDSWPLETGVTA